MTVTSPCISNGPMLWHPIGIYFIYGFCFWLSFMGKNINLIKNREWKRCRLVTSLLLPVASYEEVFCTDKEPKPGRGMGERKI